jgi:hypothetical protein
MGWTHRPDFNSPKSGRFVRIVIPVIVVIAAVVIAGLVTSSIRANAPGGGVGRDADPASRWNCAPARPTLSPSPVVRGASVSVVSGSAHCARPLPDDAVFPIALSSDVSPEIRVEGEASVRPDGSFDATLAVPADFPVGPGRITVDDWAYVPCVDTVQLFGAGDGMRLVSCAEHSTRVIVAG